MRIVGVCVLAMVGVAALAAPGCQESATPRRSVPAATKDIDTLIADLQSDEVRRVEMAAMVLARGDRPAADLQKAIPTLKAAAKKDWKLGRINDVIARALQVAKRAKP